MTGKERHQVTNGLIGRRQFSYPIMATGLGAYGAAYFQDQELALRVWKELLGAVISKENRSGFEPKWIADQGNQENLREISWISTNFVAQFCLNVIMALNFIRDSIPKTMEEALALVGEEEDRLHKA